MATTTPIFDEPFIPVAGVPAIPMRDIAPWAVLGLLLAIIFLYFVSTEQGAVSLFSGAAGAVLSRLLSTAGLLAE